MRECLYLRPGLLVPERLTRRSQTWPCSMLCHAMQGTHRTATHISSEWGPARRHRNFHCNLVLQIWNPRGKKRGPSHRTRSAAAAPGETPRQANTQQYQEPQANLHALALDQIIAIIIQHLQDQIDPNATPSTRPSDLPAFRQCVYRHTASTIG